MKGFTENTRVQVPAAMQLCRLGYEYLDDIRPEDFDASTNILTGIFTKDGVIQGKNADEVIQIVKSLQPSTKAQVVSSVVGLAGTALVFWGAYKLFKSALEPLEKIGEEMRKEENKEEEE